VVETELSLESCLQAVEEHLQKPDHERDVPFLLKLWRNEAYFKHRRQRIAKLGAGQVQELLGLFPLLDNLTFVCTCNDIVAVDVAKVLGIAIHCPCL